MKGKRNEKKKETKRGKKRKEERNEKKKETKRTNGLTFVYCLSNSN